MVLRGKLKLGDFLIEAGSVVLLEEEPQGFACGRLTIPIKAGEHGAITLVREHFASAREIDPNHSVERDGSYILKSRTPSTP